MRLLFLSLLETLTFMSTSCKSPAPAITEGGSEQFFMYKWVLAKLGTLPVPAVSDNREAHLLFFPGQVSKVSGSTGCNRLNGTMELNGTNGIRFSQVATTKMMCPEGADVESKLLDVLAKSNAYHFRDGKLFLLADKTELATFRSVKVEPNQ